MHPLIERQTHLLRQLTSPALIFGTPDLEGAARDPELQGMDVGRLRLEAEFSYNKRMSRIRQTFERTATLLGHGFSTLTRDYAAACPPLTYERYPDAERFFERFLARGPHDGLRPPWTADVAAIELALARARTLRPAAMEGEALAARPRTSPGFWYRTHPCASLVRCGSDVRSLFELARSREPVTKRPVHLVVLAVRARRRPKVLELAADAFTLLEGSREWRALTPAADRPGDHAPAPTRAAVVNACGPPGKPETAGTEDDDARRDLVKQLAAQGLALVDTDDARDPAQA